MSAMRPLGRNKVRRLQLRIEEGVSDPSGDGKPPAIPNSNASCDLQTLGSMPAAMDCAPPEFTC